MNSQRVRERGTARGRREPPCPLYALVFLRPEDFLTVGEAICTTLRICVMVSARERENIGQVTNGFAEFKDALAQGLAAFVGGSMYTVGRVGYGR